MTYVIPARYFVSTLQSLFLAGNIPVVLLVNVLFLIASAVMFIGLTWLKTKRTSGLICLRAPRYKGWQTGSPDKRRRNPGITKREYEMFHRLWTLIRKGATVAAA